MATQCAGVIVQQRKRSLWLLECPPHRSARWPARTNTDAQPESCIHPLRYQLSAMHAAAFGDPVTSGGTWKVNGSLRPRAHCFNVVVVCDMSALCIDIILIIPPEGLSHICAD